MSGALYANRQTGTRVGTEDQIALAAKLLSEIAGSRADRWRDAGLLNRHGQGAATRQAEILIRTCLREDRAYRTNGVIYKMTGGDHTAMVDRIVEIAGGALYAGGAFSAPLACAGGRIDLIMRRTTGITDS